MTRASSSLTPAYFQALYERDPDPWRFASSAYERQKYDTTVAALPRARYGRAVEVGCSIGVLTARLAERCDSLLAVDAVDGALVQARRRCEGLAQVRFAAMHLPEELPRGGFDLILLSEVVYYWDEPDVGRVAAWIRAALRADGDLVLVHWTGPTDYPLSGDAASDLLLGALAGVVTPVASRRERDYRLDVVRRA